MVHLACTSVGPSAPHLLHFVSTLVRKVLFLAVLRYCSNLRRPLGLYLRLVVASSPDLEPYRTGTAVASASTCSGNSSLEAPGDSPQQNSLSRLLLPLESRRNSCTARTGFGWAVVFGEGSETSYFGGALCPSLFGLWRGSCTVIALAVPTLCRVEVSNRGNRATRALPEIELSAAGKASVMCSIKTNLDLAFIVGGEIPSHAEGCLFRMSTSFSLSILFWSAHCASNSILLLFNGEGEAAAKGRGPSLVGEGIQGEDHCVLLGCPLSFLPFRVRVTSDYKTCSATIVEIAVVWGER